MSHQTRSGILTAGNFIVDCVKVIDRYPGEDMLAIIHHQTRCNGGGPYNVLKDLAAMKVPFPLFAAGCVGADADGEWIRRDCEKNGIDISHLITTPDHSTSYTDVMSNQENGRRTFFHQPGANALFDGSNCDFMQLTAKIFHLGYLMLLEKLDRFDLDGKTGAAKLLSRAVNSGLITTVDMVSSDHSSFREIVLSSLPAIDFLIINELEASRILSRKVDAMHADELRKAAEDIILLGVRKAVVIHTTEGSVAVEKDGKSITQGSVKLPERYIKGANGAGDAFAAGFLYGLHENWNFSDRLQAGVCAAAACLSDPTPSNGLREMNECLELGRSYGFREF